MNEMTEIAIRKPESRQLQEIETRNRELMEEAAKIEVNNQEDYNLARDFIKNNCISLLQWAESLWKPIVDGFNRAHKEAISQAKAHTEPPRIVRAQIEAKMKTWEMAERRRIEEENRRREEENKRRIEEQQRIERENQRKAEELRQKALKEAQMKAEEERLAEAEKLAKEGNLAQANAILEDPIEVPNIQVIVPVTPLAPVPLESHEEPIKQSDDMAKVKRWGFRIVEPLNLRQRYTVPDEKAIRKVVNALGMGAVAEVGEGSIEVFPDLSYRF